jgi:hypothetical protein
LSFLLIVLELTTARIEGFPRALLDEVTNAEEVVEDGLVKVLAAQRF